MANPSVLLAPTNITTGYAIPSLAAGSNRILLITVCMYNGGGTARIPSSVTVNGVSATRVSGDEVATVQTRLASATYIILEANIATVSGQVVSTSGHLGTVKNMSVMMLQNTKQGSPTTQANFYQSSSGVVTTIPLTRAADSLTVSNAYSSAGSQTMTNPTKDVNVNFTSGGALNVGYENDTANTSNSTASSVGGGHYLTMHVMNYEVFAAITVDDINGDTVNPDIDVAATNTATTTGLGTITSLTIGDGTRTLAAIPSMPSGDGTFAFTWPYADGVVAPLFGSVTATFGDGTNSAAMVGNTPVPSGYASVTFSGATDIGDYYLGHALTLPDGMRMYYPIANGAVVNPDGSLGFTSLPYTFNTMLHNVHSGGDGTITSVTVDITATGVVVITGTSKNHYIGFGIGIGF